MLTNPSPKNFERIPGVGPRIAQYIWDLGFQSVEELKDENPEELYERFCTVQGKQVDRCLLYIFRSAVYYASRKKHDPELLKWWNWKNKP